MQLKLDDYKATDQVAELQVELAEHRKTEITLRQDVAGLEVENKEQGRKLHKLAEGESYVKEIKLLMEDLRMWKSKNEKMDEQFRKDLEKQQKQKEHLSKLEQATATYES